MKKLEINDASVFTLGLNGAKYKLAGLYFKPVESWCNECITDFDLNPIAFVGFQKLNTTFARQPTLIEVVPVEIKKYHIAFYDDGLNPWPKSVLPAGWRVTDTKYESIDALYETHSAYQRLTKVYLLED